MTPRSTLRLREAPHTHPLRREETIIEVLRDGVVVATIYGSREGVHIVSERFVGKHRPFFFQAGELPPGYVVPLLAEEETCPWCEGRGEIVLGSEVRLCLVCRASEAL